MCVRGVATAWTSHDSTRRPAHLVAICFGIPTDFRLHKGRIATEGLAEHLITDQLVEVAAEDLVVVGRPLIRRQRRCDLFAALCGRSRSSPRGRDRRCGGRGRGDDLIRRVRLRGLLGGGGRRRGGCGGRGMHVDGMAHRMRWRWRRRGGCSSTCSASSAGERRRDHRIGHRRGRTHRRARRRGHRWRRRWRRCRHRRRRRRRRRRIAVGASLAGLELGDLLLKLQELVHGGRADPRRSSAPARSRGPPTVRGGAQVGTQRVGRDAPAPRAARCGCGARRRRRSSKTTLFVQCEAS